MIERIGRIGKVVRFWKIDEARVHATNESTCEPQNPNGKEIDGWGGLKLQTHWCHCSSGGSGGKQRVHRPRFLAPRDCAVDVTCT